MDRRQPLQFGPEDEESVGDVVVSFLRESDSFLKRPSEERFGEASKVEFEDGGDGVCGAERRGGGQVRIEGRREGGRGRQREGTNRSPPFERIRTSPRLKMTKNEKGDSQLQLGLVSVLYSRRAGETDRSRSCGSAGTRNRRRRKGVSLEEPKRESGIQNGDSRSEQ